MKFLFTFILCVFCFYVNANINNLIQPNNHLITIDNQINFAWNNISNSDYYKIKIASDSTFNDAVIYNVNSNDTTIELQIGDYYWLIQAIVAEEIIHTSNFRQFTIIDINNLSQNTVAWYNSDSSIIIDSNDKIEEWYDISPFQNHAYQTTSIRKPSQNTSNAEIYNKKSIYFDGTTFLNTPDLNLLNTEVFLIGKGNNDNNIFLGFGNGYWINLNNQGSNIYLRGDNYQYFTPIQPTGIYQIQNFGFINGIAANDSTFLKINSVDLEQGKPKLGAPLEIENLFIGGGNSSARLNGEIAEIIVFDNFLDSIEREKVTQYLRHKYAPPVNLGFNITQYGFCDTTIHAGNHFVSYEWSDGSTNEFLTINKSGKYWVEATDIFGFVSTDTIEVKHPKLNTPTRFVYCKDEQVPWQPGIGEPYSYLWSDGSTGEDLTIVNPGDYYVTITDTNGCFIHSDTITFMEDPFVTTASLGSLDTNMCIGNELYLSAGAEDVISYLWSTGASTPSIEITQGGNYSVEVTNDNGCVVEETIEITIIGDAPNTEINIPSYACLESEFDFSDASTTLDGSDIISWAWEFGDGHESTNPTGNHSYSVAGDYTVSLQIETSSGCFGTSTANFEVKELPALNINTQNYCQYEEISFIGGQNSPTLISDWQWDFGDPQSGENIAYGAMVSHSYESSGAKEVQLIAEDIYGCIDTLMHTLDISPTPIADFEFTEVCEGGVVNFTNTTNIDYPGVVGYYQWSFGEGTGSSLTHPQKPFSIYGDYTVSLTAGSNAGCNSSISYPLKVHAFPSVDYELTQNCAGISAEFKDVSFVPNGSVAEVKWGIDGAVPDVGFGIEKTFDQAGNYQLDHVVTSAFGCTQTQTTNFTIHDYLNADFVFDPLAFVVDYPIDFVSTSVGADVYAWTFGDFAYSSASDTSIVFEEDQIGDMVEVQLYIENEFGCMDSISLKREVLERHTDLDISQLYVQDIDGFSTLGVRIKNNGTTPIESVDLFVQKPGFGLLKETWSGLLQAGESEIHVFALSPSSFIGVKDSLNNYLCIRGEIVSPSVFKESDLSNNTVCEVLAPSVGVMIRPFPNPVRDLLNLHIVLGEDTKATVKIYDNVGRLVHVVVEDGELEKGLNVFEVEVGDWGRGVYVVRFEGGEVEGVRFVK